MAYETAWRILGNASDAEDAVQECLLHALRLHQTQIVQSWGALLRHLATCRALDMLRKRHPAVPLDAELTVQNSWQPEAIAIAAERASLLRQALAQLPPREAEVFSLRYFGELSNPQIAEVLNMASGAVAVALHKARTRLRTLLSLSEE